MAERDINMNYNSSLSLSYLSRLLKKINLITLNKFILNFKDLTRIASNFISHFCKIQEKEANLALCQSLLILILRKKEHSY
jgi:hypothetical protein